ncbi:LysM peptidoglycan-binding domain-containing protein [Pontibacter sp. E15-1]|uniref:LysM peptidoglycan-binding domain-containing protein n=1 Tax=Pontibacter sp. E15-1 TaxID=2919918 RepID=UPI001F5007DE|nr:LysM peptidoglycan-binding domain-containing protein [Pontibacter sp. E15-1]MCJ8165125.1 LysM peptidoglycan-binding domain-containing protein [Pontibacter sp. E15-1]
MRKSISSLFVLLLLPLLALAQFVTVPRNVNFADIHLVLSGGAQEEIQKKVDALHRNQTYFKLKVDLADAYFPIIERVFKEEGVPDDYKYLALQESGLIGDAVSTSNAVGYWQFKREAASDFNLRMDNKVDERRHIIEASRGAAKYFKRSNNYYNNWFNSLLSYYLGYSGAKTYTQPSDNGARKMEITERSHPYVLTFLAHKIAYDAFVGKSNPPALSLREMRCTPGQSLADIAMDTQTDYIELEKYNKWLLGGSIPSDKDYYVIVPVRNGGSDAGLLASKDTAPPLAKGNRVGALVRAERNGLTTVIARPGDTKDKLALQAGISTRRFLKYNDLRNFDRIEAGTAYYIESKRSSAEVEYHVVQPGESMQQVAQHYGVKLNYLLFKNRMNRNEVPVPGRVLWLQKRRPAHTPVEVRDLSQKKQMTKVEAAPSYTQPKATVTSPTPARKQDEAPKENIFKRFINSFKRFNKEETTPQQEVEDEEELVATEGAPVPSTPAQKATVRSAATVPTAKTEADDADFIDPIVLEAETDTSVSIPKADVPAKPLPTPAPVQKKAVLYPQTDTTSWVTLPAPEEATATVATDSAALALPADTVAEEIEGDWVIRDTAAEDTDTVTAVRDIFVESGPEPAAKPTAAPAKRTPAAAPVQPVPKPTRHTVKAGETLYGISRMYAVTIHDLTAWNKLGSEALRPGQELYIAEPLAQPAQEAVAANDPTAHRSLGSAFHTVVASETLYQISRQYEVSLEELRNWNNLADNSIRLGQELRIQAPAKAASTATDDAATSAAPASGYHTVASGESMYQISRKYGVTIKDIMEWNNKSDFSVSIGEKLRVRKK